MFIHQPLVYCHFAQGVGEPRYHQVQHIYAHTQAFSQSYFNLEAMLLLSSIHLFFINCGNKMGEFNCF